MLGFWGFVIHKILNIAISKMQFFSSQNVLCSKNHNVKINFISKNNDIKPFLRRVCYKNNFTILSVIAILLLTEPAVLTEYIPMEFSLVVYLRVYPHITPTDYLRLENIIKSEILHCLHAAIYFIHNLPWSNYRRLWTDTLTL